ncbi:MAG: hypothetical protein ACE5IE_03025 [Dehalococcoidia bacterium]
MTITRFNYREIPTIFRLVEDEGSYLPEADLAHIGGEPLRPEKPFEVIYAVGDNLYGVLALAFAMSTQSVSCDKMPQLCG